MPVLRRPYDHHRYLRARLHAQDPSVDPEQDRHIMIRLMTLRPPIAARPCRWSSAGDGEARLTATLPHNRASHSDTHVVSKRLALTLCPRPRPPHLAPTRPVHPAAPQPPTSLSPLSPPPP